MDGLLSSTQQAVHSIELFSYRRHTSGLDRSASDLLGGHHAEQVAVFGEVFEGTTGEVAAFESDIVIDSISGSRYCPCIAVPLLNVPGWLTFGSPPTHP